MKRFITYLYAYKDGQKVKNTGHIRVDVRNQNMEMKINIKDSDLENKTGTFYIIERSFGIQEKVVANPVGELSIIEGQYTGSMRERYNENIIGVAIKYENESYMASCWKDGEEEVIARGVFCEPEEETLDLKIGCKSETNKELEIVSKIESENMLEVAEVEPETIYRKINLNEIATLPSCNWHYSTNSFLIHGFWNYGYLVLKETVEEGEKKSSLGIPGIFEQPEMVMATYFGFPMFQTIPPQVEEMEIGDTYRFSEDEKNQEPKDGTFGCWFVDLLI